MSNMHRAAERRNSPEQQWSNQVRLVTVSPNGAPGHYDAFVNGKLVVSSSRQPFLDAARALLERGADSNSWLILRHADSDTDSLRAKVGVAAQLTVRDRVDGVPTFRRLKPCQDSAPASPMRSRKVAISGVPAATGARP
jgi:hypothetical protein